jgi:cytochrome o ubiquinol oxidase operon protein cyoD
MKRNLTGCILASVLTVIPFALVAMHVLSGAVTFAVIAVTGILQIVVHLRFFLNLDLSPFARDKVVTLAFATVLIAILMGGSIWILLDLNARMMNG